MVAFFTGDALAGTWDGGGNGNINHQNNWDFNTTPVLAGGTSILTFGSGGSMANINVDINIAGIIINRDGDFTIVSDRGMLTLGASGISVTLPNITSRTHNMSEAILLSAAQSWSVANNGTGVATLNVSGAVSGSFGFTKTGSGTLSLSGSNSYSGNTSINQGTLILGSLASLPGATTNGRYSVASGATLAVSNTLTDGNIGSILGTTNFAAGSSIGFDTSAASRAYAGAIGNSSQGARGLVKLGTNTLTLSGTNIYSGGTTVRAGTLAGTTLSLQGNITNNSVVTFDQSTAGTYSGAISGTGSLTKNGTGNVTLAGSNSYGGGTFVAAGTLTGTTASLQGNISNSSAVTFDQSTAGIYAGAISGTGSLTKTGTGAVTFTGNNSYSGNTSINQGTLILGSLASLPGATTNGRYSVASGATLAVSNAITDGNIGSILGTTNFAAGSSIGFDTSAANRAYAGAIGNSSQGARGLIKLGTNTLTLSGTNTYSGGTTVSGGTLVGTTSSLQGNITNNSAVTFDQSTTGTYSGVISGTGSLTKSGVGTVTLAGSHSYAGGTSVTAGKLVVNGSLASSSLTVANGASLGGSGVINGNTTISGIHTPGNSPGLQTFSSGLNYLASSTLAWELEKNTTLGRGFDYDAVNVTGGNFSIQTGAIIDLSFGGTVDFENSFWAANQEWLVVDVQQGALAGDSNRFNIGTITGGNYDPSAGAFSILRKPGSSLQNSVYLMWTPANPIPEPSISLLGVLGSLLVFRRRRS